MITDLPTKHFKRHHSDKHFSEFLPTRWRQKSTGKDMEPKLYHCHPMYKPTCCFSSAARYKRLNPEYSRGIRNVPLPAQQPTARQILSRSPSGASRHLTLNVTRSTHVSWHVSSRSGVATLRTAIHLLLTYLLTYQSPQF